MIHESDYYSQHVKLLKLNYKLDDNKKNNVMNNPIKNKRKHSTTSKTTSKHKTKANESVWHWLQYADIMFEFSLLSVVMLLAFSNINRILLLLVIPASILLGVFQSALIINDVNDKIICFISTSIIYALMISDAKPGLQVILLSIMSIIIGWISTYIAYIISIKKRNANNNVSTANTTTVNTGMSDNTYYTV